MITNKINQNYFRELGAIATDWELRNLRGIIYKITNLINYESYIGQTIRSFTDRYKRGEWWSKTTNPILKASVSKYGKENFKIEIFEYNIETIEELNRLETMYIILYNALHPNGFNLDLGGNNKSSSQLTKDKMAEAKCKTYYLVDSEGKEYEVKNLRKFCLNKSLLYRKMQKLTSKQLKSACGFYLKGIDPDFIKRKTRIYHFMNLVTKEEIITNNYCQFAKQRGLNRALLSRVLGGFNSHHKDWIALDNVT